MNFGWNFFPGFSFPVLPLYCLDVHSRAGKCVPESLSGIAKKENLFFVSVIV